MILALAGLKTLNLKNHIKQIFSLKEFIPTAGQGIIAVQCRENDEDTKKILKKINHINTEICALAERSFLKTLGGDCDTAVGCSAVLKGNNIDLEAQLFSDDGKEVYNVIKSGKSTDPQSLGKVAGEEILKSLKRQALHAHTLGFVHPTTNEEVFFTSELPDDLNKLKNRLETLKN